MQERRQQLTPVEVDIELPSLPVSPWLRLGTLDVTPAERAADYARMRRIDDFNIHMLLEGKSWVWCESLRGSIDVNPGDIVFVPPGFVYGWNYSEESHIGVHFDLHAAPSVPAFFTAHGLRRKAYRKPIRKMPIFCLRFAGAESEESLRVPLVTTPSDPDLWRQKLEMLVYLYQTRAEHRLSSVLIVSEIIGWALSTLAHGEDQTARGHAGTKREIAELLRDLKDPRMRAELERLTIDQLAYRVGFAPRTFRNAFKAATSRNPYEYMVERRIEQAAGLLARSDSRIRDIALAVGYDDPYHFSRVFHRVMGVPPQRYREMVASGEVQIKRPEVKEDGTQVVPFGPREQQEYKLFLQVDDSEA